jgi:exosome complex RNA-binding protein Csl4
MSRVTTAVEAIYKLETIEELYEIYDAIKLKQNQLTSRARRAIVRGDTVSFHSRREGSLIQGTCTKVNRKTAEVAVLTAFGKTNYKVPLNMLKVVDTTRN